MKRYSKKEDYSYTLGTTLTFELLNNKIEEVLRVYINSKQEDNDSLARIIDICRNNRIEIVYSDKVFNKVSDKENCFIIGVFRKFESKVEEHQNHIVLVNPSNSGNLGTIIRTALGFEVKNIAIIIPAADVFDPKVIRASMGALFSVNFQYFESFKQYSDKFCDNHYYPFMLQTANMLPQTQVKLPYSLIFGNESTGLNSSFQKIGTPVRIEHSNKIDSLNLDNAVSIALYEFTKKPQ